MERQLGNVFPVDGNVFNLDVVNEGGRCVKNTLTGSSEKKRGEKRMSGIKTELTFHRWAIFALVFILSVLFYRIEFLNSNLAKKFDDVRSEITLTSEALIMAVSRVVSKYEDKNRLEFKSHTHRYFDGRVK